jgi:hypothetical protein
LIEPLAHREVGRARIRAGRLSKSDGACRLCRQGFEQSLDLFHGHVGCFSAANWSMRREECDRDVLRRLNVWRHGGAFEARGICG